MLLHTNALGNLDVPTDNVYENLHGNKDVSEMRDLVILTIIFPIPWNLFSLVRVTVVDASVMSFLGKFLTMILTLTFSSPALS